MAFAFGLQPRQAFPTLPGFADLTWPDSCSYVSAFLYSSLPISDEPKSAAKNLNTYKMTTD
jgi:hypothetical protein